MTVPFQQALLPLAFRTTAHNLGPNADRYTIAISNVSPGWQVFTSGIELGLSGGVAGLSGVYLKPTGTSRRRGRRFRFPLQSPANRTPRSQKPTPSTW